MCPITYISFNSAATALLTNTKRVNPIPHFDSTSLHLRLHQQNILGLSTILQQHRRRRPFHHFEGVLPSRRRHLATRRRVAAAGLAIAAAAGAAAAAAASFAANASVVSSAIAASAGANAVAVFVVVRSLSSHRPPHKIRQISQLEVEEEEGFAGTQPHRGRVRTSVRVPKEQAFF